MSSPSNFLSYIQIKGARVHNLKNIDLKINRNKFIVISGLSGSGKSSWHLIPCMPKVNGGMSKAYHRMPASSWGGLISLKLII